MKLEAMLKLKTGWASASGPHEAIILSSRVRLARNLSRQPFPPSAGPRTSGAVLDSAFAACRKAKSLQGAAFVKLEDVEDLDRDFLVERRLASPQFAADPKNRGVVVGDREILSVMVNEEDHLRLQAVDSGLCLDALWKRVDVLDDELAPALDFAFRSDWGYLTSCPTNTGTGMRVSALAHLTGLHLTGQLDRVLEGLGRLGMSIRGLYGEGTKVVGDFFQISNATAMGRSEPGLVFEVQRAVEGLLARETEARRNLSSGTQRLRLEDLVYRSVGLLSHARSISFDETMQHLSSVRLAISLGWKVPVDVEALNELLVLTQPAHIQMIARKELGPEDRDFLRATLLRRRFGAK